MYKLAFIFLFLAFSNAKNIKKDHALISPDYEKSNDEFQKLKVCLADPKETLWVLDIIDDDLNFKELRSANKLDNRVYRETMAPAIKFSKQQEILKEIRDEDKKTEITNPKTNSTATSEKENKNKDIAEYITKYDVKKLLYKMVNKFILFYQGEPTLKLHSYDDSRISVKLYFKGQYTSLVIRYKNQRWHYFINPPSSLPRWFYEKHEKVTHRGRATYVQIPDKIKNEFYVKFFYLLNSLLSYAI
ncbi:uncharacterized protein [Epargyreus clarus]|uniref:uncharacterized protein n=1 Tax=Epargyreus clarus TaxID=520877 RepID=UPI003C2FFDE2